MNDIDLSIIIVNWNTCELLRDCIHSINRNRDDLNLEILVIDNNSSDTSVAMMRRDFPNILLIENHENLGFAKANNQGLQISKGRCLFLLNPDTVIQPEALTRLVRFLDEHPGAGAVAAKLLNSDMTLQYSVRHFPNYLTPFTENSTLFDAPVIYHFSKSSHLMDWDHNAIIEVDQPAGAAFMIKRSVIETLGVLDNEYHMFFEDVDLCYRITKNGWKIFYLPDAIIVHHGGQSVKQRQNVGEEFYRSLIRYFRVHFGIWSERRIRVSMLLVSSALLVYSTALTLFHPSRAYHLAKTSLGVFRCAIASEKQ